MKTGDELRSTFLIDSAGRIAAIFRKVKPEQHVDLVRQALKNVAPK
jgi:peroxiredoxin